MSTTAADERTPKHRLIDDRLGRLAAGGTTLAELVATKRKAGDSWRRIASDVASMTGEDVAPPTLILWFPELTGAGR